MFAGKIIVVVMPACNAEKTLRQTYDEVMEQGIVDHVVVVDDASHDDTAAVAARGQQSRLAVKPA